MVSIALKNICKRKTRSILTILGILVAMQLYIILSTVMNSYERDMQKQISGMSGRIMVQVKSEGSNSFFPLDNVIKQDDANTVLNINGVDKNLSSKILFQSVKPSSIPNTPPSELAVGIEPGKEQAYIGNIKVKGSSKLVRSDDVLLGAGVAYQMETKYGAKLGSNIDVKGKKFTIVGILPQMTSLLDSSIIMPLPTAQEMFVRPELVSAIMITALDIDKIDALTLKIKNTNPKLAVSTSNDMKKSADDMLAGQKTFFGMIDNTIVVVAAFIIMIVMIMAVFERKKEIGTLKAIGATRRNILSMIITESLTLSVIGGLFALPVSILLIRLVADTWAVDITQWGQTIIVTAVIGVLAGIWPAWSAQRVNPLESLRYE